MNGGRGDGTSKRGSSTACPGASRKRKIAGHSAQNDNANAGRKASGLPGRRRRERLSYIFVRDASGIGSRIAGWWMAKWDCCECSAHFGENWLARWSRSEERWDFHAWRALRHRNFRLYFGGQTISLIGTWMTRLATSWLVYRLTGSALLLGVVGFAGQIPTFLLAPFAGVWIDRLNRHRVLVVTQILAMLQSFALAALTLSKHITVQEIIWLGALQGAINAFDMPGRQAFLVKWWTRHTWATRSR